MNDLQSHIDAIKSGCILNLGQIESAVEFLIDDLASQSVKYDFLKSLSERGDSAEELAQFVECFIKHSVIPVVNLNEIDKPSLDIVGTGGDHLNLFNISTTSMFVAAGAGAAVVKHGNRGATSKSGGADVLEALGVNITLSPQYVADCLQECGCAFLFAPIYHPAFKSVAPVRKVLGAEGIRTIFNLMGPLMNPVRPENNLIGIPDLKLMNMIENVMTHLGKKRVWVVCGETEDGRPVDEVSLMGRTTVYQGGTAIEKIQKSFIPEELGLQPCRVDVLVGGTGKENALIVKDILTGKDKSARRDMILINTAASLTVCGLAKDMKMGIDMARESINSGAAYKALEKLRQFSQRS